MSDDNDQTTPSPTEFDFSKYPYGTLFHDRRDGRERRSHTTEPNGSNSGQNPAIAGDRRAKKERRRRIDPTTFEKQYTADELEFMNAMQRFKEKTGASFPTHGEVLRVAASLGYRRMVADSDCSSEVALDNESSSACTPSLDPVN
jgi:hypothetical protein